MIVSLDVEDGVVRSANESRATISHFISFTHLSQDFGPAISVARIAIGFASLY